MIDEADEMLEMGFLDQVAALALQTRPDRQTVMFTATWVKDIEDLAQRFLKDPLKITVGDNQGAVMANTDVEQRVIFVDAFKDKLELLTETLKNVRAKSNSCRTLVFVGQKYLVDTVAKEVAKRFPKCVSHLHGDLMQQTREWYVEQFKSHPKGILVATDLVCGMCPGG